MDRGHSTESGFVLFVSAAGHRIYREPHTIIEARTVSEVGPALSEVNRLVATGLYAAGFVGYEAAPAFDPAMVAHPSGRLPLLWFGLYPTYERRDPVAPEGGEFSAEPLVASVGAGEYGDIVRALRGYIAAGDTYQVNYTFPMHGKFSGDPRAWFTHLCSAQPSDYSAYLNLGRYHVVSVSPELFFRIEDERIEMRPMKGTARRGLWSEDDSRRGQALALSEKDRAENVMIVDLIRNDLGRIARPGSVVTPRLFEVERYPTLWQMTSTVRAQTEASVPDIFKALFPAGSVTGAPKIRTMEIIREMEKEPRGVYCGAIGWWSPGRKASFSVGIRTATVDSHHGQVTYSVGSGVTWGSSPDAEFEECTLKAAVTMEPCPNFDLLESILWDQGFYLLDGHLRRLASSAEYFGITVDLAEVRRKLEEGESRHGNEAMKVRLLVARTGTFRIEWQALRPLGDGPLILASDPVDTDNRFLYHKTTHRTHFENERIQSGGQGHTLFWNQREEITESANANVAVLLDGTWYTPPVKSGLLPGVMREHILHRGELKERLILVDELGGAEGVALINSVRKWFPVHLLREPQRQT